MSLNFDMTEIWTFFQNYENKNKGHCYSLVSLVRKVPPRKALSGLKKTTSLPSDTNDYVNANSLNFTPERNRCSRGSKLKSFLCYTRMVSLTSLKHFLRPCKYRNIWCINTRKSSHSLKGFQSKKTLNSEMYTLFKTQVLKKQTLFSGTYPYRPNMGVPPPGTLWSSTLLKSSLILCIFISQ